MNEQMNYTNNMNDMLGGSALESDLLGGNNENGSDAFSISIVNKTTQHQSDMRVLRDNTLGQVCEAARELVGISASGKVIFENKETAKSSTDSNMTVGEFGLKANSLLVLADDGCVACCLV